MGVSPEVTAASSAAVGSRVRLVRVGVCAPSSHPPPHPPSLGFRCRRASGDPRRDWGVLGLGGVLPTGSPRCVEGDPLSSGAEDAALTAPPRAGVEPRTPEMDPGDAAQQEAKQREAEMRNSILAQVLDQSARARCVRTRFDRNT
ncbi:programmed cell death protein 5 isoform X1 [Mus musculus]|uniref:programmed cell death protein 5 isoform X1 n=1 Tax=Mus musculus TaxID=10090 RepID=UPI00167C38E7|nr:programmed cell death protein 5 isoform X1 [Mus musculus]